MSKCIAAEKLIAEIERYKQRAAIARFDNAGENADYFQGKVDLCDDLTHLITSLQQEQPKADIVKEYDEQFYSDFLYGKLVNRNAGIGIARYFYELGLNARKEDEK